MLRNNQPQDLHFKQHVPHISYLTVVSKLNQLIKDEELAAYHLLLAYKISGNQGSLHHFPLDAVARCQITETHAP